jgi:hypothetical protein
MATLTRSQIARIGALVAGTATLVFAGCGGSSSTGRSAATPPTTTASNATGASRTTAPFNAQLGPVYAAAYASGVRFHAAFSEHRNYDTQATAARAHQSAETKYADQLAALTPPPAAAAEVQANISAARGYADALGKLATALSAHDSAAIQRAGLAAEAYLAKRLQPTERALAAALGVSKLPGTP